jgi:hypothetical protein
MPQLASIRTSAAQVVVGYRACAAAEHAGDDALEPRGLVWPQHAGGCCSSLIGAKASSVRRGATANSTGQEAWFRLTNLLQI